MKNRKRESCTSGTVRDEDGDILIYSANDREDRGNVGIIRSPVRATILPDRAAAIAPRDISGLRPARCRYERDFGRATAGLSEHKTRPR